MISKNRLAPSVIISIFIIATLLNIAGVHPVQAAAPRRQQETQTYSCLNPASYEMRIHCANLEAIILAVTVRIEMHAQHELQGNFYTKVHTSHATIIAGRYLVTHNHFKFPLTKTAASGEEGYFAISLRKMDGSLILYQAPLNSFEIVHTDSQTLVLEFLDANGSGLFAAQGLSSAYVADWHTINLQPGMELAQLDWNGLQAHVVWVRIDNLHPQDATPQLQVNNFARLGCSGGGVFWNGQHIGNNWARSIEENHSTGEITRRYSLIALNSSAVIAMTQ
jgi:hypothetical protein